MNDKTSVPPYEANPSSFPQTAQQAPMHTADSHTSTPGQPMVQHDIYQGQTPISPMQTGTTNQFPNSTNQYPNSTNQYPNQPLGSPPLESYQHQQPTMAQQQPMATPIQHPKGDYYGSQQQVPMQQVQPGQPPMQTQQSQYHTATPLGNLGEGAAPVDCPCCRQRALTRTSFHSGNTTNVWALIICACFCLGCIPYLIPGLKDVEHNCGNCGVLLATWKRSGHTVVHQHG